MATSIDHRSAGGCRSGQAALETLIVMLVACLLLFGLLQVAHGFAEREIVRHAAACAARARTVGFNHWMCSKVMRAAAIPASGRMLVPADDVPRDEALADAAAQLRNGALWDWAVRERPGSARAAFEAARIPDYLASANTARADEILDYEGWDDISASGLGGGSTATVGDILSVKLRKRYPLSIFVRMLNDWAGFVAGGADGLDSLELRGNSEIESHYPLYIDDKGW